MAETYQRVIVYHKWAVEDIFRPLVSFSSLKDAVKFVDEQRVSKVPRDMKVIDLEHIDMGDMMVHPDTQTMISRFRQEAANA